MGILAKNILTLLKQQHHKLYQKIVLHISDFNQDTLDSLQRYNTQLMEFQQHLSFDVIDLNQEDLKLPEKPILIYMTYLLDSLNTRYISHDQGYIEYLVESSINDDVEIIAPHDAAKHYIKPQELMTYLNQEQDPMKRYLVEKQLLCHLKQEFYTIAIDHSTMNKQQSELLTQLCDGYDLNDKIIAYSPQVFECIERLVEQLAEYGSLLSIDFGSAQLFDDSDKELDYQYGATISYGISYGLIEKFCKQKNYHYGLKPWLTRSNYAMLISKSSDNVNNTFKALFNYHGKKPIDDHMQILFRNITIDNYQSLLAQAPQVIRDNYTILINIANFLYQQQHHQQAKHYCQKCLAQVPNSAEVYVILAKIAIAEEEFSAALSYAEKAATIAPQIATSYELMHKVYQQLKQPQKAASMLEKKKYYSYDDEHDQIENVL